MLNCPNRLAWASVDWCGGWLNCTLANLPASRAPLLRSRSSLLQSGPRFRFSLSLNFRIKGLSRLAFSLSVRPGSECTTAGAWNLDPLSAQEHKRTPAGKSRAHPVLFTGWRLQLLPARFSLGSSPDQRCPCVPDLFPGSSQFDSLILHPSPLPTAWFSVLLLAIARPVWTPSLVCFNSSPPPWTFSFLFLLFLASFLRFRDPGLCRSFTGPTRSAQRWLSVQKPREIGKRTSGTTQHDRTLPPIHLLS